MKLFERLRRRRTLRFEQNSLTGAASGWYVDQFSSLVPDGYSRDVAQEFPAVGAAVRLVSRELARMRIVVEDRTPDEWAAASETDPEVRIVAHSWDDFRSRSKAMALLVRSMMLDGFGVVWVERDPQLRRLRVLDPTMTARQRVGAEVRYQYSGLDAPRNLDRRDLLWLEYEPDFGDGKPTPPLMRVWPDFRMAVAAARFAGRYFDAGAQGNTLYQMKEGVPATADVAAISEDIWREEDKMRRQGRRSMAAPPALTATQLSGNAKEADVVNLLTHGIQDVARVFGVPPMTLQELSRGTYSNYAQSLRYLGRFTLTSLASAVSEEISRIIWPRGFRRARLDVGDIGDESLSEKTVRLREAVAIGALSQNDMREALGLGRLHPGDEFYEPDMDAYVRTPTFPVTETLGFDPNGEDMGDVQ